MRPSFLERRAPSLLVAAACCGLAAANWLRLPAVAAGAVAVLAVLAPARLRPALLLAAVAAAGLAVGSLRVEALERTRLAPHVGEAGRALVVVTGPARRSPFRIRLPALALRFRTSDVREPVQLELPVGRSPPQGAVLELVVSVAEARTGGEFDERAWLARRGVHVVLRGRDWRVVGRRGGIAGVGDRLRAHVARSLAPARGERRAVLAGVVLGDDEGLSDELQEAFRASGLYHLLAVSGQNVGLLAIGIGAAAWLFAVPRLLAELVVLAGIAAYVLAVGWQPSVVRAGVAGALASLAWLAARPRDRWHFLLLGALVLLAWNPHSLLEPGFQLSFAAVAAIFVSLPRAERALEGYPVPRVVGVVVAISAACSVATAPIVWLHFGAVPLWSVPANALAAPAAPPLLGLGLLAAAVEPVLPAASATLAWAGGLLAAYLAAVARLVGGLPLAELTSWGALGVVAVVVVAAAVRRWATTALAAAVLGSALLWALWPAPSLPPPRGLRVTFLDVGQGDAILLETAHAAVLVDQGPPEADVAALLRRRGVRRLAALVLTHPQRDHIGGAADVMARIDVDLALDPRIRAASHDYDRAVAAALQARVRLVLARAGAVYRLGRLTLRVLWPADGGSPGEDPNRNAVVLVATYGEFDALLTADAETDVTGALRVPQVEVLKVAHHGSADPGLPALLARVRPRVAVISVGRDNDYGHPTRSTLAALDAAPELDVYRTDEHGHVVVESDGRRMSVLPER